MPHAPFADRDDSALGFSFPAVGRKKVTAAFDGGRIISDSGVQLLTQAERKTGLCKQLAACIDNQRDPSRVVTRFQTFCAPEFWRSPEATKMLMLLMLCVMTQASALRWASFPDRARASPVSRR